MEKKKNFEKKEVILQCRKIDNCEKNKNCFIICGGTVYLNCKEFEPKK